VNLADVASAQAGCRIHVEPVPSVVIRDLRQKPLLRMTNEAEPAISCADLLSENVFEHDRGGVASCEKPGPGDLVNRRLFV
jgi:hypothetical protein